MWQDPTDKKQGSTYAIKNNLEGKGRRKKGEKEERGRRRRGRREKI